MGDNDDYRSSIDLGGIDSIYGEADEIYMEVYWKHYWNDVLVFGSTVPLSESSIKSQNVQYSANEPDANFPSATFKHKYYSDGYFPAAFSV